MKIHADITTYLLKETKQEYSHEYGKVTQVKSLLDFAGVEHIRVSMFSNESSLLSIYETIDRLGEFDKNVSLFLDVHCSDVWADPSHQSPLQAWKRFDEAELINLFIQYLEDLFIKIENLRIPLTYIQVGNEISNGMLWPYVTKHHDLINFLKVAHQLCRSYFPDSKIVLHTDLSYSDEKAVDWYRRMEMRKLDYDLIGLSYYPVWHGDLEQLEKTIYALKYVSDKKIMLCEVGYMNTQLKTNAWFGHWTCRGIPYSRAGQVEYLKTLKIFIEKHKELLCQDVFWWGMFSSGNDNHHPVSLFDENGYALPAFYELKRINNE
jgi:arabinogalactan endo-1,4-beta-galactosidase